MASEKLDIIITGVDKATNVFKKIGGAIAGIGKFALGLGAVAVTTAVTGLAFGLKTAVDEALEAQEVAAQLEAVLKATGGAAGITAEEANELADSLSKVTRYSDETVLSAETMLLQFKNINEKVFPQTTELALDLATRLGIDAVSAAKMLGKALEVPGEGLLALKRAGLSVSDEFITMIETMVAAGDTAGAQQKILDELAKSIGGAARAAGETFAGKMEIFKNSMLNAAEAVGVALLPILTKLAETILPIVQGAVERVSGAFTWLFDRIEGWGIDAFFKKFEDGSSIIQGFFEKLGLSEDASTKISDFIFRIIDWFRNSLIPAIGEVKTWLVNVLVPAIGEVGIWFSNHITPIIRDFVSFIMDRLIPAIRDTVTWFLNRAIPALSDFVNMIGNNVLPLIPKFSNWFWNELIPAMGKAWGWILEKLIPAFEKIANTIITNVVPIWEKLINKLDEFYIKSGLVKVGLGLLGIELQKMPGFILKILEAIDWLAKALVWVVDWYIKTWEGIAKFIEFIGNVTTYHVKEVVKIFYTLRDAVQFVIDKINALKDAFHLLELPDWLTPGSPTPLEMGLRGIGDAMGNLTGGGKMSAGPIVGGGGIGGGRGGGMIVVNINAGALLTWADSAAIKHQLGPIIREVIRTA